MREGPTYHVLVNRDTRAPRIVEVLGEAEPPAEE